jgi:hypothetical protein
MEKELLACALHSRQDYEQIVQYIPAKSKSYSPEFQVIFGKISEWYDRDTTAQAVSPEVLTEQLTATVRSEKAMSRLASLISEAASVSVPNVMDVVLSAKRQEVADKLAAALVSGEQGEKVDDLLAQYNELKSATSLDAEDMDDVMIDVDLTALLTQEYDPTNVIPLYPKSLNDRLDGGAKKGHHVTVFARPNCVAGTTEVRIKFNPESSSSKLLTLEKFHARFNGDHHLKGDGPYMIQSTSKGRVFYNEVKDVISSGTKPCWKIVTESGDFVEATEQHVMLTGDGYRKLSEVKVGDRLVVDRRERMPITYRKEYCTKLPYSNYKTRVVSGHTYNRVSQHRFAYDANLNGYSVEDFMNRLKQGGEDVLQFSDMAMDIHHINGDHTDNRPENLMLLTHNEHLALHARAGDNGNSHRSTYSAVVSIEYVGDRECYDIVMYDKCPNFKVNSGLYVHNCGKTAFTINLGSGVARYGKRVMHLINEDRKEDVYLRYVCNLSGMDKHGVRDDPSLAQSKAGAAGLSNVIVIAIKPGTPDQIKRLIQKYQPDVVIVDQLRNLQVKADSRVNQLESAATAMRNIGKQENVLMVSVTQAGDSARDKLILDDGDIDFSNTGIPAQADLLIGIGCNEEYKASGQRIINLIKNKIGAVEEHFPVKIFEPLSRYTSV